MANRALTAGVLLLLTVAPAWVRAGDAVPAAARRLTLDEAVGAALAGSPLLRSAEAQVVEAYAGVDLALSRGALQVNLDTRYLGLGEVPTIDMGALGSRELVNEETWQTTFSVSRMLYTGGRVSAQVRQAGGAARAAEAGRDQARQMVACAVETAYRLLVAADGELAVAAQARRAAEEHLRVTQAAIAGGTAARFDLLRAEVAVEEARQQEIAAGSDRTAAEAGLNQALGMAGTPLVVADPGLPAWEVPPVEALVAVALEKRPELIAWAGRSESLDAAVESAEAERRPNLGVSGDYQFVSPESATQLTRWSAAAFLSFPILDGGRASALETQAKSRRDYERSRTASLRSDIEAEVRRAHARVVSASAQGAVVGKRLEQAEELLRLANVRFAEGVGTSMEVVDALSAAARARQGVIRTRAAEGVARAELVRAVGGRIGR
jgi:outer membrane protein TolC